MAQLFDRRVRVEIDDPGGLPGVAVEDLRVTFRVKKTIRKEPNQAEVEITNFSRDTRARLKAKGVRMRVFAGYSDLLEQVFHGDVRTIDHVSRPPDWVTVVRCGDGEIAYAHDRFSKSYAPGTNVGRAIADVVKSLRVKPGAALQKIAALQDTFVGGYVAHGRSGAELDRLLAGRGLEWSIQDGELQLLPTGGTLNVTTVLSPDTGLIGSPEHGTPEKKGGRSRLRFTSLLQPQIRPGGRVRLQTGGNFDGTYRVESVEHRGDTAGGEWYSEVEGILTT